MSSLLWSIDIGGHSSYLLGTMHTRSQLPFQLLPQLEPLLAECPLFCAEMNLDQFDAHQFMQYDGPTLRQALGARKFSRAHRSFLRTFQIDLNRWNTSHPFLLNSHLVDQILPADNEMPFDHQLWIVAQKLGVERSGLESFQRQLEIMHAIPLQNQFRSLYLVSKSPDRLRRRVFSLLTYYRKQDITALYQSTRHMIEGLRRLLLFDRNREMSDKLLKLTQRQPVFAAVGAAHLSGGHGMLRMLKHAGATVKPIPLSFGSCSP